jgi:hypothetical protein
LAFRAGKCSSGQREAPPVNPLANRLNDAVGSAYVNVFFAFPALGRYLLGRRAPPEMS